MSYYLEATPEDIDEEVKELTVAVDKMLANGTDRLMVDRARLERWRDLLAGLARIEHQHQGTV